MWSKIGRLKKDSSKIDVDNIDVIPCILQCLELGANKTMLSSVLNLSIKIKSPCNKWNTWTLHIMWYTQVCFCVMENFYCQKKKAKQLKYPFRNGNALDAVLWIAFSMHLPATKQTVFKQLVNCLLTCIVITLCTSGWLFSSSSQQ